MNIIEAEVTAARAAASGAHAAPQPASTRWGRIHADVTGFGRALLKMSEVTGRIALDPKLEEGVELLMTAAGLGAEARDMDLVLVQLRHIVATLQAAQPAPGSGPQFLPAPAQDGGSLMPLFRKKPVVIEAVQWTGANMADVITLTGPANFDRLSDEDRANCDDPEATAQVFDKLHSTWVLVFDGQWIIRGVKGEFYPCAPDVLAETYERVIE